MAAASSIWIGVSGWSYASWKGKFYPERLPARRQLEFAARRFNSVEVNGSFYSLVKPDTWSEWYETAPAGFLFAVKGSRFITHNKKLADVQVPLANFFSQGLLRLKEKLGPIVWQLPELVRFSPERAEAFFRLLPRDSEAAARLARRRDFRMQGRDDPRPHGRRRLRHALEVRHPSWCCEELVRLARRHRIALVFADSGRWLYTEELTAGFVYLRLHGSPRTYASTYGPQKLERWAARIRRWSAGEEPDDAVRITGGAAPRRKNRDVYVYFDNDAEAHAPRNARDLAGRLGIGPAA